MNTFAKITGGEKNTPEEVYEKFPWLKSASFEDAQISIEESYLVWEGGVWGGGVWQDGVWKDGRWKGGVWKDGEWKFGVWQDGVWGGGVWQDGLWKDGQWEDGVWEGGEWGGGKMWSNIHQKFVKVKQINGNFKIV